MYDDDAAPPTDETTPSSDSMPVERDTGAFGSIRNTPFYGTYLAALALSMTGNWVRITAMGFLVYEITNDEFRLGVISFVQSAPQVLLSPLAGAFIDRLDRRKLLLIVQLVILAAMITLTGLIATDRVTFGTLVVIAIIIGSMLTFDWPARLTMVPQLVPREDLGNAVALNSSVFNGAKVVGPALGGLLISFVGITWAFGYIALVAVPFIFVVYGMKEHIRVPQRDLTRPRENPFRSLIDGYKYTWRHEQLRAMLSVDIIPIVLGMSYVAMAPAIVKDVLDLPGWGLGALLAFNGVGSLVGTLSVAKMSSMAGRGRMVVLAITAFAVILIAFGLAGTVWLSFPLAVILGGSYAFASTMNDTLIQTTVDDEYRGRVLAVYSTFWGFSPAGALLAGWMATFIGVQWAVAVTGMLVLAYVPYLWFRTPMRSIS